MKAGTTTLFHYLNQHPKICRALKKEIDFFIDENACQNIKNYDSFFDFDKKTHKYKIDASTSFTKYPVLEDVAKRVYESGIEPKMIYILRNPYERINSEINFWRNYPHWSHPKEKKNFDAMIARSNYYLQLKQYIKYFPKNNILLLDFDKLKSEPQNVLNEVCEFCNIEKIVLKESNVIQNKC